MVEEGEKFTYVSCNTTIKFKSLKLQEIFFFAFKGSMLQLVGNVELKASKTFGWMILGERRGVLQLLQKSNSQNVN